MSIGTVVTLKDEASRRRKFTRSSAHGTVTRRRASSPYLTTIGQAILGHKVGETVQLPSDKSEEGRPVKIEKIVAYKAA